MNRPVCFVISTVIFIGPGQVLCGGPPDARVRDVEFVSREDGTRQRYVVVLPDPFEADQVCDVLIAFHGHGSDRWQFVIGKATSSAAMR